MRHFISFLLLLIVVTAKSQGFRTRHYIQGVTANITKAIFETAPGVYIGGGLCVDSLTGNWQICMVGMGAQGQVLWQKKYGNGSFQYIDNSFTTRSFYKTDGHIYYTGCVRDTNNKQIGVLIKFDFNGDTLWQKTYRDNDIAQDVIPQMITKSVDGGFLITGFFQHWGNHTNKCLLIKTDLNGDELWRKEISKVTPNTHDGRAIIQDSASKKIVIAGYQYIGNANSWTNYANILILDSLGVKLNQINPTPSGGVLCDMIQTKDKKIVAVGEQSSYQSVGGTNLVKSFAVKFDLNTPGVSSWNLSFDQLEWTNVFTNIVELPNGELLLGAIIDTMPTSGFVSNYLIRLTKLSPTGPVSWNRYYNYKTNSTFNANYIRIRSLDLTSDGSWIGAIEGLNSPTKYPLFFVKWDANGCDSSLAFCESLKYVGIENNNHLNNNQVRVYPNPANQFINIAFERETDKEDVSVVLTDIAGRDVKQTQVKSDDGNFLVNLTGLNEGIYLLRLKKNNRIFYQQKISKEN